MHLDQKTSELAHAPELMDARFWMHAQFPRNTAALDVVDAEATAVGACGDAIHICLRIENDHISDVQAIPDGCVYTVACASAVSVLTLGAALEDALEILPDQVAAELGGLPEDHLHCARLAVNTVGEAIADYYQRQRHRPASPASA
jgi:nitrogen fixation NifU-like protein